MLDDVSPLLVGAASSCMPCSPWPRQAISEDLLKKLEDQGMAPLQMAKLRKICGTRRGNLGGDAGTQFGAPAVSMRGGVSCAHVLAHSSCLSSRLLGPYRTACTRP